MGEIIRRVAKDDAMSSKLTFCFVGSGTQQDMFEKMQRELRPTKPSRSLCLFSTTGSM